MTLELHLMVLPPLDDYRTTFADHMMTLELHSLLLPPGDNSMIYLLLLPHYVTLELSTGARMTLEFLTHTSSSIV